MSAVHLLMKLGACREAIDWADDHAGLSDADLWLACDDPHWLAWIVDRSRIHDPLTLIDALKPIWRARKDAIYAAYEAQRAADDANEPWDHAKSDAIDQAYIDACNDADGKAASMIRHTVALPTRGQLRVAAEYWARFDDSIPY